jgi:hypothetical protein
MDDASPDGTDGIVKKFIPKYPRRLHLIERLEKLDIAGLLWGLVINSQAFGIIAGAAVNFLMAKMMVFKTAGKSGRK